MQSTGPVLISAFFPREITAPHAAVPDHGNEREDAETSLQSFVAQRLRSGSAQLHAETIDMVERFLLTSVLRHTDGNQSKAAEILGITRGSLRHKIRELGISIDRQVTSPEQADRSG